MHGADVSLVVSIRGLPLVLCVWRAVVGKTQAMPVLVLVVLIQQPLVSTIKTVSGGRHRMKCPVFAHVWRQDHHTAIECIGPTNVWSSSKWYIQVEQFVQTAESDYIGVQVDNLAELCLPPQSDLGKAIDEVRTTHKIQIGRAGVTNTLDGDEIVVQRAEFGYGVGRQGIQGDESRELLLCAGIAQRVCKDDGS